MDPSLLSPIVEKYRPDLAPYEELYKHLHANPELSTQEKETSQLIAERLSKLSSELDIRTNIGGHGLVAILENGSGKTVLLRADIDGLPVEEKTGLDYASKKTMKDTDGLVKPTMHGQSLAAHFVLGRRIFIPPHITCIETSYSQLDFEQHAAMTHTLPVCLPQPNYSSRQNPLGLVHVSSYSSPLKKGAPVLVLWSTMDSTTNQNMQCPFLTFSLASMSSHYQLTWWELNQENS